MTVKSFGSESELNAHLRRVTDELRKLGDELRASLRGPRRSLKRALDDRGVPPKQRYEPK